VDCEVAAPGKPLALTLQVYPAGAVKAVRLHYRPLNQLARFKTIEAPVSRLPFTIPAADISGEWDLMYYFECLAGDNSGWFHPDPWTATPYYVVETAPSAAPAKPAVK